MMTHMIQVLKGNNMPVNGLFRLVWDQRFHRNKQLDSELCACVAYVWSFERSTCTRKVYIVQPSHQCAFDKWQNGRRVFVIFHSIRMVVSIWELAKHYAAIISPLNTQYKTQITQFSLAFLPMNLMVACPRFGLASESLRPASFFYSNIYARWWCIREFGYLLKVAAYLIK